MLVTIAIIKTGIVAQYLHSLMKATIPYNKDYSVYPGEYIPLPEVEALLEELKLPRKTSPAVPPLNMDEFEDYFKIEVVVPGVKREEIIIYSHENILSIAVLHKDAMQLKNGKLQIHEFDSSPVERHILLPDNADSEFISAEYRQGMLLVHIPKSIHPSMVDMKQIAVY